MNIDSPILFWALCACATAARAFDIQSSLGMQVTGDFEGNILNRDKNGVFAEKRNIIASAAFLSLPIFGVYLLHLPMQISFFYIPIAVVSLFVSLYNRKRVAYTQKGQMDILSKLKRILDDNLYDPKVPIDPNSELKLDLLTFFGSIAFNMSRGCFQAFPKYKATTVVKDIPPVNDLVTGNVSDEFKQSLSSAAWECELQLIELVAAKPESEWLK